MESNPLFFSRNEKAENIFRYTKNSKKNEGFLREMRSFYAIVHSVCTVHCATNRSYACAGFYDFVKVLRLKQ